MKTLFLAMIVAVSTQVAQDLKNWTRFQSGGHPDYAEVGSLDMHAAHCVWHEGHFLYLGNKRTDLAKIKKNCRHSAVKAAADPDLVASLNLVDAYFNTPGNGGYEMVKHNLRFMMVQKGYKQGYIEHLAGGRLKHIRAHYIHNRHDAHTEQLVRVVSDNTLGQIIREIAGE